MSYECPLPMGSGMHTESQHSNHSVEACNAFPKHLHQLVCLVINVIVTNATGTDWSSSFFAQSFFLSSLSSTLLVGSMMYECNFFQHSTVSKHTNELVMLHTVMPNSLTSMLTGFPPLMISVMQHLHSM